ncbi:ABC-2 type transport system permease protein [Lachnospiraceae bacterium YSD2013]|nr:ABC-2 type transport system permease protein [Lachnospiraceae bacterium YSD2013]
MITVCRHELKLGFKTLLIWSLSVGIMGLLCILMYTSMEGEMADMAESFSKLGAFSDAFGMSTLSIATLGGFFATEVGTVHGLGSAMFAAITAAVILSKEEDGHTGEFLYSLPISRGSAVTGKALSVLINLVAFTIICGAFYVIGFVALGEDVLWKEMLTFLGRMLLMNVEVASVTLVISAASAKNRLGAGLGLALVFYAYDLIGRVVPDMKDYLFMGPFSFTNASEIFSGKAAPSGSIVSAVVVVAVFVASAYTIYLKKDLAS